MSMQNTLMDFFKKEISEVRIRPKSIIDRNTIRFLRYTRECTKSRGFILTTAKLKFLGVVDPNGEAFTVITVSEPKIQLKLSDGELLELFKPVDD